MANIIKITVNSGGKTSVINAEKGENLLSALVKGGFYVTAPCGGRGRCSKCGIKLLSGEVSGVTPDKDGVILSCRAGLLEDISVALNEVSGTKVSSAAGNFGCDKIKGYGIALDIGTTTLAFYLMDLYDGKEIDSYSCLNPQGVFGADVISRISACREGKLRDLNRLITEKTNSVIGLFEKKHDIDISRMTVCGNTAMLHLFANIDPTPLGVFPFTPVFTETKRYKGKDLNINADSVTLLPSVSAYVGSDITAGIISTGMISKGRNNMLADIGTNGEIVLYTDGKLYCASTAAGPAFEGANISCGMGGVAGAIDSADFSDGRINFTVIGNIRPSGICGSGLTDIIAIMMEKGIFDKTGTFAANSSDGKLIGDKYYITDNIYISQKDVREFQLAKSAICSGIKTLAAKAGLPLEKIDNFYIAGGLGYYINFKNAVKTGLLPEEIRNKITVVGNSAGAGAKMCLLSQKQLALCGKAAARCRYVELSAEPMFMEEYIKNMSF
jgi:uncharacterized 2Fe-2S/4Fe-4S cluster protein (DUF4445 family)